MQQYTINSLLTFGKYRGMSLKDVYIKNPRYVDWLITNFTSYFRISYTTLEDLKKLNSSYDFSNYSKEIVTNNAYSINNKLVAYDARFPVELCLPDSYEHRDTIINELNSKGLAYSSPAKINQFYDEGKQYTSFKLCIDVYGHFSNLYILTAFLKKFPLKYIHYSNGFYGDSHIFSVMICVYTDGEEHNWRHLPIKPKDILLLDPKVDFVSTLKLNSPELDIATKEEELQEIYDYYEYESGDSDYSKEDLEDMYRAAFENDPWNLNNID